MTEPDGLLNKQQRKKQARKQRQQSERQAHRNLDEVTSAAVAQALETAPSVADATNLADRDQVIDVALASESEALFVRKRVNDALQIAEWLDDVRVWLWRADEHTRTSLSERGAAQGFELRIEQAPLL